MTGGFVQRHSVRLHVGSDDLKGSFLTKCIHKMYNNEFRLVGGDKKFELIFDESEGGGVYLVVLRVWKNVGGQVRWERHLCVYDKSQNLTFAMGRDLMSQELGQIMIEHGKSARTDKDRRDKLLNNLKKCIAGVKKVQLHGVYEVVEVEENKQK